MGERVTSGRISEWPAGERPREILEQHGAAYLSDAQLLSVILRTGRTRPPASALELGRSLLRHYPSVADIDRATFFELTEVSGIGHAKAAGIKASLEFGRRLLSGKRSIQPRFGNSRDVARYFRPILLNLMKEVFITALVNGRHELIREITVSVGCLTSSIVHPREVFQPAVRDGAAAVLFVHNHPSGDPTPSGEDRRLTERLVEAGSILGIKVLDHVIVASGGFFSLLESGGRS
jgi:DNA repair protein RadC